MSSNFFVAQQTDQVGVRNPSRSVAAAQNTGTVAQRDSRFDYQPVFNGIGDLTVARLTDRPQSQVPTSLVNDGASCCSRGRVAATATAVFRVQGPQQLQSRKSCIGGFHHRSPRHRRLVALLRPSRTLSVPRLFGCERGPRTPAYRELKPFRRVREAVDHELLCQRTFPDAIDVERDNLPAPCRSGVRCNLHHGSTEHHRRLIGC